MVQAQKAGRHSVCRVYVIGAGVSATAGIAVAREILRESMERLDQRDHAGCERVQRLLSYLYPNFDEGLKNYPNIEDFLRLLRIAQRFNSDEFIGSELWSEDKLEEVYKITLRAVTDYIWDKMSDGSGQRVINDFVHRLTEGDTIVTFNWDLTMERALENYPGDPGFLYTYSRHRQERSFSLLKPHGSIDWFERKALRGLKCEKRVGGLDGSLCYYPRFNLSENPELAAVPPVIVPPVTYKEFDLSFVKRTCRFVYRAVSDATDLHIIGYSMPKEDQFARFVFRRAVRNNILKAKKQEKRLLRVRSSIRTTASREHSRA